MEQLRIGFPPRDAVNPVSRVVFGLASIMLGIAAAAVVLFVGLPIAGIIVSAALGGMLLALAGLVMMMPFILLAATIMALVARPGARKPRTYRTRPPWR